MPSFFLELGWAIACFQWKDFRGATKFSENSVSASPSLPCISQGPRRSQWLWVEIIRESSGAIALITRFLELEACQLPMKEVGSTPLVLIVSNFLVLSRKGWPESGVFYSLRTKEVPTIKQEQGWPAIPFDILRSQENNPFIFSDVLWVPHCWAWRLHLAPALSGGCKH